VGLCGIENTGEIKGGGKVFRAADSDDGSGVERCEEEHVVVWRGRSAGGAVRAAVDKRAL
jgi:hypothetical protein